MNPPFLGRALGFCKVFWLYTVFCIGFMTVGAGLHCSQCACLQKSFSICRGIQHVIGTVSNEAANDMGYRISDMIQPVHPSLEYSGIILNNPKRRKWSRSPCLALGGWVAPSIFALQSLFADLLCNCLLERNRFRQDTSIKIHERPGMAYDDKNANCQRGCIHFMLCH